MRMVSAALLGLALTVSTAFADTNNGALAPGKPAGVKEANMHGNGLLIFTGLVFIGAGIAIAASGHGNGPTTSTTTTAP